ncbi:MULTISPECIES: IS701 family transposase [Corallococcus]|uniref:IS701 family transposase n=1 Tax=Corallococcus TaxID=83461 RepID=UPI000ED0B7FC|nr:MULTISPECIES: IS701 family transposase [Corallococcus]NPC76481.1 IS701 family transposase [Corallococcus exiguus]NPD22675.1 IS701 family transposase [Corallococcus exiguus]RKH96060.1 IS701 family transposase [Corallococcus sp. AB038B]
MTPAQLRKLDRELAEFLDSMTEGMGRTERRRALDGYLTGLLLDGERKSIEPMAARLVEEPGQTEAMRQRLQQCVSGATWDDAEMRRRLARKLERKLPSLEAFVVDDTGFPKKGVHSVGVARQYSGTLGRTDNCQVAVSLHLAGERGSGCIAMRLYLPEEWTADRGRMRAAGVPPEVGFKRKWELALEELDAALSSGVRQHVVLADAGYGDAREFRDGVRERGLHYLMGVQGTHKVWPPGASPRKPEKVAGKNGRPRTRYMAEGLLPWAIAELALQVPREKFHTVRWREGSRGEQSSRFAAVRVHTAERHVQRVPPSEEVWLLLEWPRGEAHPTKHYLSSLPEDTPVKQLVRLAKLRWRVERDYQEMKGEVGLDHFEGRSWRGFHHHATLCMVAHGFLALHRALFPPEQDAMDAAAGAAAAPTPAAASHRLLSPMPASDQRARASSWAVTHVTE